MPKLDQSNIRDLRFELVDYDSVRITHENGRILNCGDIRAIGVGTKASGAFGELSFKYASYDAGFDDRSIDFDFTVVVDSAKIMSPLTIRYYHVNSTITDVDTAVPTYTYPYASTEIVVTDSILGPYTRYFQDIDIFEGKLYCRSLGPSTFYVYDLTSGQHELLGGYPGGDHIAVDSGYMFLDYGRNIYRFNLLTRNVDFEFPALPERLPDEPKGLATHGGYRYLFTYNWPGNLKRYRYDGTLIDSISITIGDYYMTIENGVIYLNALKYPGFIRRFDLRTNMALPVLIAPSRKFDGIKAIDGWLYFCDYTRRFIGRVPLGDMRTN